MPSKPKLADPGALIRGGKPRTLEYRVCLHPDLIGEYEQAVAERDDARVAARDSLAAAAPPELEQRVKDLLEQIENNTVTLTFKALTRPAFKALMDQYPPRKDAEGKLTHLADARLNVNIDEFFEPLIRASLISPELDDETMTVLIEERLTDGQWDDLTTQVWNLNEGKVDVPFSSAASRKTTASVPK